MIQFLHALQTAAIIVGILCSLLLVFDVNKKIHRWLDLHQNLQLTFYLAIGIGAFNLPFLIDRLASVNETAMLAWNAIRLCGLIAVIVGVIAAKIVDHDRSRAWFSRHHMLRDTIAPVMISCFGVFFQSLIA